MNPIESLLLRIGRGFTVETYLLSTKIQAVAWSCADILIVLMLLKIASLLRAGRQGGGMRFRFFLLWTTALLTPALIFAQTARQIFVLESLICGGQFAILLYTVLRERGLMMAFLEKLLSRGDTQARS